MRKRAKALGIFDRRIAESSASVSAGLAPMLVPVVFCALAMASQFPALAAQTAQPTQASQPVTPVTATHKHKRAKAVALTPIPEERPPDPPPPDWPANDPAKPASVNWNGHMLSIAATNSSLQQILTDVSTATGVKLEGSTGDQRVYGNFGPASARDVLGQLLEGSDYNVLMIGEQGQGTPRRLVLTSKANHAAAPNPAANNQPRPGTDEEAPEDPEPQEQPDLNEHRPLGLPTPQPSQPNQSRTPQEILQEMQQRQQQLQQQQAQPGQTPNPNQ